MPNVYADEVIIIIDDASGTDELRCVSHFSGEK